jgi:type I site-specific restriction-modification system R (restriction) subunit
MSPHRADGTSPGAVCQTQPVRIIMSWKELDDLDEKVAKLFAFKCSTPGLKVDIQDLKDKAKEAFSAFTKGKDALADLVEKFEDATDAVKNGLNRQAAVYPTFDFDNDPKKKDEAKKIAQARNMYATFFSQQLRTTADDVKTADELQKHLTQLGKYKGPGK